MLSAQKANTVFLIEKGHVGTERLLDHDETSYFPALQSFRQLVNLKADTEIIRPQTTLTPFVRPEPRTAWQRVHYLGLTFSFADSLSDNVHPGQLLDESIHRSKW